MEVIIWILIIAFFILSFLGILFPIVPSVLVLWLGFLAYHFFIDQTELGWVFYTAMVIFTIILIVADIIANSYFVKKFGGSKRGEQVAAVAVIVGSFIIPPFGILIVPFIAVLVTELLRNRTSQEAIRASIGSFFGFLSGSIAKVVIQLVMIVWFFVTIAF
ncbi:DUF456 domain-containing protein [Tenuibacillus multivorans]|uniref:DUF456 domain-containing protein n=1 Tax=Tenuibacillus multivorans TaxID=237069 RepID=A0A1H0AXH5_9BACI|nr:DUF456 domain-containing protein [Tenuibacillus multivorans]GEL77779.1 membrane protein [Tenuibacillus multivorans]SDN37981.1 hypothetical protein SAMN05216498_2117 [Tenuibacillus multivorans]